MRHTLGSAATALAGKSAWPAIGALAFVLCLASCAPRAAAADDHAQARIGGDVFAAGGALTVRDAVAGDLFVAGGSVDVDTAVAGDVLAAAGKLQLSGDVAESVHAAAGQVAINGRVGGHLRAAGGQVVLGPPAEVLGNVSLAAGQMRLLGAVRGDVFAAGGRLWIDAAVGGDVVASTGLVELGPNARIAGKLRHRGGAVQRDPAAVVTGGIESWFADWGHEDTAPAAPRPAPQSRMLPGWPWTLALALLAAVSLALLPGFHARVASTLRQRPGLSFLLGAAWLIGAPLVLLLLLITVIGIPLTVLGAVLYIVVLPLAYVSTAIALGDWALQAGRSVALARWGWRVLASAVVLVLLSQTTRLPWLGTVVVALALLAGLGALVLQLHRQPAQAR
ncbi:MAG TPA: polymer-forming cytoskeletal protein [Burkholderiaceae bacterium]